MTISQNLLTIAIKFSPNNGIIQISLSHDAKRATPDIEDQSSGVAAEDITRIL